MHVMSLSNFGDVRLNRKHKMIIEGLLDSGSCSIHKTFEDYNTQKSCYRFLANVKVTESTLIDRLKSKCENIVRDKDVIVLVDTTDIRIDQHKGRMTEFEGIGIIDKNQFKASYGFFVHPLYVMDEHDDTPYGLAEVEIFNRSMQSNLLSKSEQKKIDFKAPIEQKESYRWIRPCIKAKNTTLSSARRITYVMDREADIWEVYKRLSAAKVGFVIRAKTNRELVNDQGRQCRLKEQLSNEKPLGYYNINYKDQSGTNRVSTVQIRAGSCKIKAPKHKKGADSEPMSFVEVKSLPEQEQGKRIHWILWTNREVKDEQHAKEIIKIYTKRWKIEVFFKLIKSDGYRIENSQLEKGKSIRKLTLLIMEAALKIEQLKSARKGGTNLGVENMFNAQEIKCLKKLNKRMSGNTKKQKNPYPTNHLAWATWVIARLAGWKGFYGNDSPPGNKTLKVGLEKFEYLMIGYSISK